jgi:xanthine dehydrogenase accessory factor
VTRQDVLIEAGRLAEQGSPYALATVIRVSRPASARAGDRAIVTPDGVLHGWVGGACSEPAVIREGLRALADGRQRVLRVCGASSPEDSPDDVVLAASACASEGMVELLIEPELPAPLLAVIGESPAAACLTDLARRIGWRVATDLARDADAVVVASMGRGDEETLAAALATPARYVGLVASSKRASVVLASLRERGLDEETLARLRSPAGLDLGRSSQEEIAVAILAELIAWRHTGPLAIEHAPGESGSGAIAAEAVDPVCGMTVSVAGAPETAIHEGVMYFFCCAGCRQRFEAEPSRYLTTT